MQEWSSQDVLQSFFPQTFLPAYFYEFSICESPCFHNSDQTYIIRAGLQDLVVYCLVLQVAQQVMPSPRTTNRLSNLSQGLIWEVSTSTRLQYHIRARSLLKYICLDYYIQSKSHGPFIQNGCPPLEMSLWKAKYMQFVKTYFLIRTSFTTLRYPRWRPKWPQTLRFLSQIKHQLYSSQ